MKMKEIIIMKKVEMLMINNKNNFMKQVKIFLKKKVFHSLRKFSLFFFF